jgi:hypothetical protein
MKKVGKVDPCVTKIMYSVQDYSVLYNKAFLHVRKSNQHGDRMELYLTSLYTPLNFYKSPEKNSSKSIF